MHIKVEFKALLQEHLLPGLRALGFSKSLPMLRRQIEETIHCVFVQGDTERNECYFNWGYHLTFFPGVDASKIVQPECEIRSTIQPETQHSWQYGSTASEMEVNAKRMSDHVLPKLRDQLTKLSDPEKIFCDITLDDIIAQNKKYRTVRQTAVRTAQFLYHVNMHYGHVERAVEIAKYAVETGRAKTQPWWHLRGELKKQGIHIPRTPVGKPNVIKKYPNPED